MTVSVRIIGGAENWIRSLVSYRDYFRCMYGSVQYTRDTRPVQGYVTTQVSALGTASPYGFRWDKSKNPDVAGWSPFVTQDLSTAPARGYQRTMIWTPTGLYQTYSYNPPLGITTVQYPFQFMTQNDAVPAMASTLYAFSKLPPGLSLGFWWGTSLSLRRTWNSPPSSVEELDPSRADHQLIAFYELDYARRLGATLIGLDSFGWTGPQVLTWIDLMRAHAPEVTFIPEHSWDVLHARVPMWRDGISLTTPPVLADFLLPGHETWCSLVPANFSNESNAVAAEAQRLASMGCTIVMYDEVAMPAGITTAASWETTIPADLR
jgi:hypothetical protein